MNERRFMMLALMPLALVALLFAFGMVKERLAADQAKTLATNIAERFPPIQRSLVNLEADPDVHARLWELSVSATELERRLSAFTEENFDQRKSLVKPGEPWDAGPIVIDIAQRAEPLVAEFERLLASESPSDTLRYFSLDELLIIQLRAAVYENDREQALRTLRRMQNFATDDLAHGVLSYRISRQYNWIQQSLAIGFWEQSDDLNSLRELVSASLHLRQRWNSSIRRQLMLLHDSLARTDAAQNRWRREGNSDFFCVPGESERYSVHRIVNSINASDALGSMRRARELRKLDNRKGSLETMTIVGIPFADCRLYNVVELSNFIGFNDREFASEVFHRRMTLTAIGVKQFQKQAGRWPTDLEELSQIGLTPQDWCYEPSKPFRYGVKVTNDEKIAAVVWVDREFQYLLDPPPESRNPESTYYVLRFNPIEVWIR